MAIYVDAVDLANMKNNWYKHPKREGQEIQLITDALTGVKMKIKLKSNKLNKILR